MAWRTGEACGFTDTRSAARRCRKYSADMMLIIDADDAWCPPTFTPDGVCRTLLAWWTMLTASHSTRRCTASSVSRYEASSDGRSADWSTVIPQFNRTDPDG